MFNDSQIIYSLEREASINEIIGRKFFKDLFKWFPTIRLVDDTLHEEQFWGDYTIVVPHPINSATLSDETISVVSNSTEGRHTLSLSFKHQDPNNTTLPLRSRTLFQNILQQLKDQDYSETGTKTD